MSDELEVGDLNEQQGTLRVKQRDEVLGSGNRADRVPEALTNALSITAL